jgi:mannose-6-phosphate isomerase-like protein (cupin superfamily)
MRGIVFIAFTGLAFVAGFAASRWTPQAHAQAAALTAQILHVPELTGDALGPAAPLTQFRNKMFVAADGMTISVQSGNVPKHMHPNTNEIQYILEGTGTMWLGDRQVRVQPGDLIVIPKGTPHAGTKPDTGVFRSIAIKTPPQPADDTKLLASSDQ